MIVADSQFGTGFFDAKGNTQKTIAITAAFFIGQPFRPGIRSAETIIFDIRGQCSHISHSSKADRRQKHFIRALFFLSYNNFVVRLVL